MGEYKKLEGRYTDQGDFRDRYVIHVSAMTDEELHSKSDIAAELAYRDQLIAELENRIRTHNEGCKAACAARCAHEPRYLPAGGSLDCGNCAQDFVIQLPAGGQ